MFIKTTEVATFYIVRSTINNHIWDMFNIIYRCMYIFRWRFKYWSSLL